MAPFRLLIVDDHPIVLAGLRLLFADASAYAIVTEAASAEAARAAAQEHRPDIIVTDLVMGGNDRAALIEDLVAIVPGVLVLVYSSSDEAVWARHALRAGARGYVSKAEPLEAVAAAVDRIVAGEVHVSAAIRDAVMRDQVAGPAPARDIGTLSARELQILSLMGDGCPPQSIGQQLGLSIKTVGTYRERLKIKLGLESMRMLERFAEDHVAGGITPR